MLSHEFGYWLQQFMNACTLASFYVPLAVAFALMQGITSKIFLSFGDFAMFAAFAAIYAGLTGLLAGNNIAVILAKSLVLAVLSSSALGHFAATHVFSASYWSHVAGLYAWLHWCFHCPTGGHAPSRPRLRLQLPLFQNDPWLCCNAAPAPARGERAGSEF
jgi:hypothetical protein